MAYSFISEISERQSIFTGPLKIHCSLPIAKCFNNFLDSIYTSCVTCGVRTGVFCIDCHITFSVLNDYEINVLKSVTHLLFVHFPI